MQSLLNKAKEKYLEVEGRPADDDEGDVAPVIHSCVIVSNTSELMLPTAAFQLLDEGFISDASRFVRITIADDDDSDSDSDDAADKGMESDQCNGFQRIVISEDATESDDEEVVANENVNTNINEDTAADTDERNKLSAVELETASTILKEEGNALMMQHKFSEAIDAYTRSLTYIADFIPSLNNRAQAYLMMKVLHVIAPATY